MSATPPPRAGTATPTKAGITETADGQRIIPASVRADGSVRREIRVKPGYRPPEDIEVYKNRTAEAWKNRGSGGVPGAAPTGDSHNDPKTPASAKNAKRRAARKKAKEIGEQESKVSQEVAEPKESKAEQSPKDKAASPKSKAEPTPEEKEKQAKAIRKKIRQASELKSRKEGGENLLPEQLDKIIKMNELVRQLRALGFEE